MSAINYFERGVLLGGDTEALVSEEGSYTYNELKEASIRVAAGIIGRGDHDQSRLAVYSPNTIHVFPCMLGGIRAGNIMVPANALDEVSATVHFFNLTKTKWLFYHSSLSDNVEKLREQVPSLEHFVCIDNSTYEILPEQLDFFTAQAKSEFPLILLMHIPLYMPGTST